MTQDIREGTLLWSPTEEFKKQSNMSHYMKWLASERNQHFNHYQDLWQWSVTHIEDFWESIWDYYSIPSSGQYLQVLSSRKMPGAKWFEGVQLNYAEYIFHKRRANNIALISQSELRKEMSLTWEQLEREVGAFQAALKHAGIKKGDRIAAYLPNIPETIIAFLACASIGAVWSSCSPDFGSQTVIDRVKQIEPKILLAVDGYRYGGKDFSRLPIIREIQEGIPSIEKVVLLPYLEESPSLSGLHHVQLWEDFVHPFIGEAIEFHRVPFDHPLWILYSSGTTGLPKAIVQGHGGILLEHLKQCHLHTNLKEGDRFFWFTTTGWMMWNLVVSSLLTGATALLFDGNPGYPNLQTLWKFAEETKMTHFGTSASFLLSCMQNDVDLSNIDLSHLQVIGSTGSPLPVEGFRWVYENVKKDLWLISISGGTDVCSAFVGGCPLLPVRAGEIQCSMLGAKVQAFNEEGKPIVNEVGELVITEPMPSMPIYFWNDPTGERYDQSYFSMYPGIWRHGDWIKLNEFGSSQIYGRSDSTINRGGIRIGTSEIYRAVEGIKDIKDSLVIDISNEKGGSFLLLFVVLEDGYTLTEQLIGEIKEQIRKICSPRHTPDYIYEIKEVPRTLNGKKLEVPIKKILLGKPLKDAVNIGSLQNPDSLIYFQQLSDKFR